MGLSLKSNIEPNERLRLVHFWGLNMPAEEFDFTVEVIGGVASVTIHNPAIRGAVMDYDAAEDVDVNDEGTLFNEDGTPSILFDEDGTPFAISVLSGS